MKGTDLKNSILQMAVQGKLVPQDPNDEPASVLLERIREQRRQLIAEGKIKAPKGGESVIYRGSDGKHYEKRVNAKGLESEPVCIEDEIPFEIPEGWEWARIETIALILNGDRGKNYPAKSKLNTEGIPFVSAVNISNSKVVEDRMLYMSETQYQALRAGKLEQDDIIFCIRGSLGKFAMFPFSKGAIASSLVIIRLLQNDEVTRDYLLCLFSSPLTLNNIIIHDNGTAQPNLAAKSLASFIYPLPPIQEQERLLAVISALTPMLNDYEALETAREQLDTELPDRLRKSILQMAVQGKLVPQDPNDEPASILLERIREQRRQLIAEGKIKAPKGGESVIYRGSDGGYYEKRGSDNPQSIEVPFEIPESWQWVRLESIVFQRKQIKPAGIFSYVDIGSIDNDHQQLNSEETLIEASKAPSRARKPICRGDILYSTVRPYLHNACIVDREFSAEPIASTGFAAMVCIDGIYNKYLFRYLLSPTFDEYANANENSKGVAYPAINDKRLYASLVPVPPVNEQTRIIHLLEKLLVATE